MELIAKLFPGWGLKRAIARQQIKRLQRYYDVGQGSNFLRRPKSAASPQLNTQNGAIALRDHARHLDENHDVAIGILDTLVNNIVGSGIPIRPAIKNADGTLANDVNDQIDRVLMDWKRRPEATRTLPFDEMCRLVCRTWLRDGELLAQRIKGITRAIQHASVVPYSLELIEADFLPYDYSKESPQIIQGVEVSNWTRPVAYWLLKSTPNEFFKLRIKPDDVKRVEAERLFHIKFTRRINQIRGVTALHGAITRLADLKDYEESERIAARLAASMTGYIKKSPETSRAVVPNDDKQRELSVEPGMIFDDLLPGEEVGMLSSDRPNSELGNFRNAMLQAAAGGTGTNYSSISKNYEGSYSSQRQGMVDSVPGYEKLRNYFIEVFIRPMYNDFMEMALLSQAVRIPQTVNRETLYDVDIHGVAMPWIDPKKEMEADVLAVNNGLKSRPQVIRERGGDPVKVDREIEADTFKPAQAPPATETDEETDVETA